MHVDDPWAVGTKQALHSTFEELGKEMLIRYKDVVQVGEKVQHLGDEYERTEKGWKQRPAKNYVKNTLEVVDMQNCNPSNVIGAENQTPLEQEEEKVDLDAEQSTLYRKVTGKCTF